jgi:hypothetical protein
LVPNERVHELRIDGERASRHQRHEVHRVCSFGKSAPPAARVPEAAVLAAVKSKAQAPACGRS